MKTLVITLPDEVVPYEHDLRRFVDAMVYKLRVHSKKGKWEEVPIGRAIMLLKGEVMELEEAVAGGNLVEVLLEAADVANYGLIISSITIEKGATDA